VAAAHSNNPLQISPSHRCTVALIVLDVVVGSDVLEFAHARVLHHQTLQRAPGSVFFWLNGPIAGANATAANYTARSYLRGNDLKTEPVHAPLPVSDSSERCKKDKGIEMTKKEQLEDQADRLADAIVELVERTDGPVTLARIDREIPGFAAKEPPAWDYVIEDESRQALIWDGMTQAGCAALRKVMSGRRVAVQHLINPLMYLLECSYPQSDNWTPVVLLPVRTANLDTPRWLMRYPEKVLNECMRMAAARGERGYRRLTPSTVRNTADRFAA
jgi:hypothetical protein